MKHLVDKTILVPFREELKYAVCIVSGRRFPAFRQGKHRVRLYASRSSGQKPGPTLDGLWTERQREEKTAHVWPYEPLCALFRQRAAAMRTPTLLERVWASFWEFAEDERKLYPAEWTLIV